MSIRRQLKKLKIDRHHLRQQLSAIHEIYNKIYDKRGDILDRNLESTITNPEENARFTQLTAQLSAQENLLDKCNARLEQINGDIGVLSAELAHKESAGESKKKTEQASD